VADPTWADFRREVFGEPYMVWHDGPMFDEIARVYRDDPELVLRMLRAGLSEGDDVAAQAARNLEPTEEQLPAIVALLEAALPTAGGGARSEIATSLHALGGPGELAQHVVDVLLGPDHWSVRIDAAMQLAHFAPTPDLVAAAAAGVSDPEYLVRYHSANTLLRWAGRDGVISDDPELFALLVDDGGPDGWAEAAGRLAAEVPGPL
jgi:hypothetical protein